MAKVMLESQIPPAKVDEVMTTLNKTIDQQRAETERDVGNLSDELVTMLKAVHARNRHNPETWLIAVGIAHARAVAFCAGREEYPTDDGVPIHA